MPTHKDISHRENSRSASWDRRRRERRKAQRRRDRYRPQGRLVIGGCALLVLMLILFGSAIADYLS